MAQWRRDGYYLCAQYKDTIKATSRTQKTADLRGPVEEGLRVFRPPASQRSEFESHWKKNCFHPGFVVWKLSVAWGVSVVLGTWFLPGFSHTFPSLTINHPTGAYRIIIVLSKALIPPPPIPHYKLEFSNFLHRLRLGLNVYLVGSISLIVALEFDKHTESWFTSR